MRKSKLETADTRRRIIEVAARAFRANGIQTTGLADLMADAGLSHGGFYRHFESKDDLVAQACEAALTEIIGTLEAAAGERIGPEAFKAMIEAYVSTTHRDAPADGCPLASMGSELARADEQTRAVAAHGFDGLVDSLASRSGRRHHAAARSEAIFALSAMIGAVTMARIVEDPDASAAILQTVKERLIKK
ncbi:TetR family transcriptional regulator [Paraburkholderia sp. UYCP14C]|uniref:TetR/AcrR family transcriptional regulator n=1 Tax=Paraburkholderia sp. UYCP14C TaxID=2511130 RepID=UPI00101FD721|nr:TetR family transcriptional regulator [Paraburkholderia sp. UYCP14C]RZF29249.1 TetR family transcriptional regulator [Paraburkholderia sp. UYCP14C]